jgi:hypothetical protein
MEPRFSNVNVIKDNDLHVGSEFGGKIVKQLEKAMHRRSVLVIQRGKIAVGITFRWIMRLRWLVEY